MKNVYSAAVVAGSLSLVALNLYGCGGGGDNPTPKPHSDDDKSTPAPSTKPTTTTTTVPEGECPRGFIKSGTNESYSCFFKCESDLDVGPMQQPSHKGIVLDDTTLHWCPNNLQFHWPNTNEPVSSFRMYKAWSPQWTESWLDKEKAWADLADYLKRSGASVLVGTQISCNEEEDDADWENVLAMLKIFGAEHVMGVAIGNELELLWTKNPEWFDDLGACLEKVWNQGYFLEKFYSRARDLDSLGVGFEKVKLTSVFGGFILADPGWPFYDKSTGDGTGIARVGTFLKNVTEYFGERYAHTLNIYSYFDNEMKLDRDEHKQKLIPESCNKALLPALCMDEYQSDGDPQKCVFSSVVQVMRERLAELGDGQADSLLWIGETGWSFPRANTLSTEMQWCPDWSTSESMAKYYTNFVQWDLNINGSEYRGPDHIFYFAARDSDNFGMVESFGLVGGGDPTQWCTNTTCKLQSTGNRASLVV